MPKALYTKAQSLEHWIRLQPRQNPLRHMRAIPYKSKGSSYGACGIRIDGSAEFIDAVLSNLHALIEGENTETRLELSRNTVDGSHFGKDFSKAGTNAQVCYIRLHERGNEGKILQSILAGFANQQEESLVF